MQRGAGDGPLATLGRLGGQKKSSGLAPASGAQITELRLNFLNVVNNFQTYVWNRRASAPQVRRHHDGNLTLL